MNILITLLNDWSKSNVNEILLLYNHTRIRAKHAYRSFKPGRALDCQAGLWTGAFDRARVTYGRALSTGLGLCRVRRAVKVGLRK